MGDSGSPRGNSRPRVPGGRTRPMALSRRMLSPVGRGILVSGLIAVSAMAQSGSKPLAMVNGVPFPESRFRDAVARLGSQADTIRDTPALRLQYLDHLIDSDLLVHEAETRGLDRSAEFQEKLKEARRELLVKAVIEREINQELTDDKLKGFYAAHRDVFVHKEVRASHILIRASEAEKAQKVLEEAMAKDADFAALARKYSMGPSAAKGGDLNFFGRGRMVKEFEDVAFSLEKGKVHPRLVKTQFGYHIIKVTDIRGGDSPPFEDIRPDILTAYKKERRETFINGLRKKSHVDVDESAVLGMRFR